MSRRTVADVLARAREQLVRVDPDEARQAAREGALLLDIRTETQRLHDGVIPGSLHHGRNVLEWRADPESGHADPALSGDLDRLVIVVCQEGYASSIAAASLRELGYRRATDLAGGFLAWRDAGLPIEEGPEAPRRPRGLSRSGSR